MAKWVEFGSLSGVIQAALLGEITPDNAEDQIWKLTADQDISVYMDAMIEAGLHKEREEPCV